MHRVGRGFDIGSGEAQFGSEWGACMGIRVARNRAVT